MQFNNNDSNGNNTFTKFWFYMYMVLYVLSGSMSTISNKVQNISVSMGQKYTHSFFITFIMFSGESLCLLAFYLKRGKKNKEKLNQNNEEHIALISEKQILPLDKPDLSPFLLILPTFCDFLSCTMNTIGLTMMTGSSFQMMRGASILFVALFSKVFLRNKLYFHNYLALFIVISGLLLIGGANITIQPEISKTCSSIEVTTISILGFVLVLFASIFVAFQFILEEQYSKTYNCDTLEIVGWEGVWGILINIPVLIIFQNIECPTLQIGKNTWIKLLCTKNDKNQWILEDSIFAIKQISNDYVLLLCNISYFLSSALLNYTGITLTKIASAASRAFTDTIRTVLIWCFFLLPIVNLCNREHFNIVQFTGFLFLIAGTLINNEIVILPFGKKGEETSKELKEEEYGNEKYIENNNDEKNKLLENDCSFPLEIAKSYDNIDKFNANN